jgi:hypothetical protein
MTPVATERPRAETGDGLPTTGHADGRSAYADHPGERRGDGRPEARDGGRVTHTAEVVATEAQARWIQMA